MAFIKIDQAAYKHNLEQIALKAGGFGRIICVLKNNAYGHGVSLLAPLAKEKGVSFIALKNEREALELKGLFENTLILSHIPNGEEKLEFIYTLNSKEDLYKFKRGTRIHLTIDTGMHRNGILPCDIEEIFFLARQRGLCIEGAFTHFSSSDEFDASFFVQREKFIQAKEILNKISHKKLIFHSHNSSALFRGCELPQDEFCRVGLVQFGYGEFSKNLQKVLSLYAQRLSSRKLRKGQSVGYGGIYTASKDIDIATYDLGYADGLFRFDGEGKLRLGNNSLVLGRMSMDSFTCEDCGEEVLVFNDADIFAKFFNTINYEILSKLSVHIPRILV